VNYARKFRVKRLGLSLVCVFGLMALMAVGAQASEKSWLVEAKDITANQLVEIKSHTEFNMKIEKETNLEILCAVTEGEDVLLITGTTVATGKIKFSKCKTWQGGAEKAICKIAEPLVWGFKALQILHEGKVYILFEPETAGGKFGVVKFKEPCALPESNNLTGTFVTECLKPSNLEKVDCKQEEKSHILQPNEGSLFPEDHFFWGGTKVLSLRWGALWQLITGKPYCGHV
jgi:hypothetical protein